MNTLNTLPVTTVNPTNGTMNVTRRPIEMIPIQQLFTMVRRYGVARLYGGTACETPMVTESHIRYFDRVTERMRDYVKANVDLITKDPSAWVDKCMKDMYINCNVSVCNMGNKEMVKQTHISNSIEYTRVYDPHALKKKKAAYERDIKQQLMGIVPQRSKLAATGETVTDDEYERFLAHALRFKNGISQEDGPVHKGICPYIAKFFANFVVKFLLQKQCGNLQEKHTKKRFGWIYADGSDIQRQFEVLCAFIGIDVYFVGSGIQDAEMMTAISTFCSKRQNVVILFVGTDLFSRGSFHVDTFFYHDEKESEIATKGESLTRNIFCIFVSPNTLSRRCNVHPTLRKAIGDHVAYSPPPSYHERFDMIYRLVSDIYTKYDDGDTFSIETTENYNLVSEMAAHTKYLYYDGIKRLTESAFDGYIDSAPLQLIKQGIMNSVGSLSTHYSIRMHFILKKPQEDVQNNAQFLSEKVSDIGGLNTVCPYTRAVMNGSEETKTSFIEANKVKDAITTESRKRKYAVDAPLPTVVFTLGGPEAPQVIPFQQSSPRKRRKKSTSTSKKKKSKSQTGQSSLS